MDYDYDSRSNRSSRSESARDYQVEIREPRSSRNSRSTRSSRRESYGGGSSYVSAQSSPDRYLVPENASSADRRSVRADLRTIRNHSTDERAPQHIRNMMAEVLEIKVRMSAERAFHK